MSCSCYSTCEHREDCALSQAPVDDKIILSVAEFERRTGLSHSTVAEMIRTGEIGSFKVGRRRLIPMSAVEDWIASKLNEAGGGT